MSENGENWRMVACLPGIDLHDSVEGGDLAAAGSKDPRYLVILDTQLGVREYLSKFRTPFGKKLNPTMIVASNRVPKGVPANWIFEFRTIVAVCHVIRARCDPWAKTYRPGPLFSELFEIYPFGLGRDGKSITIQTASAEGGFLFLSSFQGSYPYTVTVDPTFLETENDPHLSEALLAIWQSNPDHSDGQAFRERVFRSLTMADYALRALFANWGNPIDIAIPLSLWVGAFEALAASPGQEVRTRDIAELIDRVPWTEPNLREKRWKPIHYAPKEGDAPFVTLPVQVYGRVATLRNDLLHGKPLPERLETDPEQHWGDLRTQVAALYRSTLLYVLTDAGFGTFSSDPWAHAAYEGSLAPLSIDLDFDEPPFPEPEPTM